MAKIAIPDSPTLHTTKYKNLAGVDYSVDKSEVAHSRTPDGVNMISGTDGNPEKRPGWRNVLTGMNGDVEILNVGKKALRDGWGTIFDNIVLRTNSYGYAEIGYTKVGAFQFGNNQIGSALTNTCFGEITFPESYWDYSGTGTNAPRATYADDDIKAPNNNMIHTFQYKDIIYFMYGCRMYSIINGIEDRGLQLYYDDGIDSYWPSFYKIRENDEYSNRFKLGSELTELEQHKIVYIPHAMSGLSHDFKNGVNQQPINLLTQYRCYSYLTANSSSAETLCLSEQIDQNLGLTGYNFVVNPDDIEVQRKIGGSWVYESDYTFISSPTAITFVNEEGKIVTENVVKPFIKLTRVFTPEVTGQDNIRVFFKPIYLNETISSAIESGKGTEVYFNRPVYKGKYRKERQTLLLSSHSKLYGYNSMDRVFCADGRENNLLRYSAATYPLYFPDNNYLYIGSGSKIRGLTIMDNKLVVFKTPAIGDVGVYYVSGNYANFTGVANDIAYFSAKPTSIKMNPLNESSIKVVENEPMFLSSDGIYGMSSLWNGELSTKNRSAKVDSKLLAEPNLEKACAIQYKNMYWLAVNGHCYLLDKHNHEDDRTNNTNYSYRAYYFENFPDIKKFLIWNDKLVFLYHPDGYPEDTVNYGILNNDIDAEGKYTDGGSLQINWSTDQPILNENGKAEITGGTPVRCVWSTPLDDDGYPNYFKTLNKKATVISIKPYEKTSVKVKVVKNGYNEFKKDNTLYGVPADETAAREYYEGLSDIFVTVDFENFSFDTNNSVRDIYLNKKIKKYKRLQIVLENDEAEPFGVIGITKTYSIGNLAK